MSNLADGIFQVALPLIAVEFTRSPTTIAGLAFAATLPWLLFALPAGALADRLDRRRAMVVANSCRAVLLLALVLVSLLDGGSIGALYAVALGAGIAETVYDTSARSIVPQLVRRDQLSRGNARLYAVELTANQFVGPPLVPFGGMGNQAARCRRWRCAGPIPRPARGFRHHGDDHAGAARRNAGRHRRTDGRRRT